MTDVNITFSRLLLSEAHREVRYWLDRWAVERVRPDLLRVNLRKSAWVYCLDRRRDHWEFHGPDGYYWHGRVHNAYEARAKGWLAWLAQQQVS